MKAPTRRTVLRHGVVVLLGLISLLPSGCGSFAWREKKIPEWSDGRAPELELVVRKHCAPFMNNANSVGLAIAVVSPTSATIMTFGRPAMTSSAQTRCDTLYEIGSITKTFTALALEREVERGAVTLDEPVQELLPAGMELPEPARGVTLRQLTTHTSGFPSLPDNFPFWRAVGKILFGGNPYDGYSEADFREGVRTVDLGSKPGTHFEYSNFGMNLLGYVLSQKAGTDYEAYIKREVCEPLGMHDTTVKFTTDQAARFAQGYMGVTKRGPILQYYHSKPWNLPNHLAGSGALRSSAADMLIYLKANMRPEGPLANAIRESHRELSRDKGGPAIGMNWIRSWSKSIGQVIIWHNGGMGGATSYLGFTEDGRNGVVILSNVGLRSVDDLGNTILAELARTPAPG